MADQAQGATGLMVKLPFATAEEFIAKYGQNISRGGIFLRAKSVKTPGTRITLDLKLSNGERVLYASGVVHFVAGQKGQGPSGMGIRFLTVDAPTQHFLDTHVAPLKHANTLLPPVPADLKDVEPAPGAPEVPVAPAPAPPPVATAAPVPDGARVVVANNASTLSAPPFEEPKEEPKRTGPIIGIDLGTTNSCAAFVRNGKPAVLYSREGYNTVPSILALNARGKLVVGHPAKGQMLTNPRMTVYGAKRLVGRAYDSPIVQEIKDRFHYEIAAGESGEAAVKLGDRVYSLQQISAMILREVREIAQNQIGQPISRAVITVPAYYNDNQRQAVREAGRMAGLFVERILNEPTAAALAYGYGRKLTQRVLIYDLGGGTFDASLLELSDNVYEVISTGGDTFLGGIDFDNAIVEHLLEEFKRKTGSPLQADRVAMQRITDAAERAKCALSERTEVRIHVPFITLINNQPYDLDVAFSRETLIGLTAKLVDRTIAVLDEVLKAKGVAPADVNEVILVGGQSRSPLVHEKISAFFKRPPSKGVHPDEAVALGAALFAHSLGQVEGVVLIDVLPMSMGIAMPDDSFTPVVARNTPLPCTRKHTLTLRHEAGAVRLAIYQGEAERVETNEYLGTLTLKNLSKANVGDVEVELTFEVSNEGLLTVTAIETSSGKAFTSTFSTRTSDKPKPSASAAPREPPAPARPPPPRTLEGPVMETSGGGLVGWVKRLFGRV